MFSYRHGFHAGAHSDILKHLAIIAILRHLLQKDSTLTVVDTHAGAGLYRLDGDYADASGEALDGIFKLFAAFDPSASIATARKKVAPALLDYIETVKAFNAQGHLKVYPGSPFIIQRLLRVQTRDKLKLFELHPTDIKALAGNIAQLRAGRQVTVTRQDGFEGLKAFLPPPGRRGLVLIDPSYEIKSDYSKVSACIQDCLERFATGIYVIWYPIIPRPEAHDLPRRLKSVATRAERPWLSATLSIGQSSDRNVIGEPKRGQGLTASGLFIVNPPHTLKQALETALPQVSTALNRGKGAGWTVSSS